MAKADKQQTQQVATEDIARFANQSKIAIERLADNKASIHAAFEFHGLRYEIEGQLDLQRQRPEPFVHRMTWNGDTVMEMTVITGQDHSRVEYQFGKATTGTRTAVVNIERLKKGALITGAADGNELVPYISGGCHCATHSRDVTHPLLAWKDATNTRPVTLALDAKLAQPLEGLSRVIRTAAAARSNGGGLGDIIDILTYILCVLECVVEGIICWIETIGKPGSDIFQQLCSVLWGECLTVCWIPISF